MKTIKKLVIVFVTIFTLSICTAAIADVPAKYNLDNQLERITQIYKYNLMSWQKVDNQSFVVQTGPSDYYLIVLSSRSDNLPYTETVKITDTNGMVKPGYNNVIVKGNGFKETYIINRIYKFENPKQVKEIEAQLVGETE